MWSNCLFRLLIDLLFTFYAADQVDLFICHCTQTTVCEVLLLKLDFSLPYFNSAPSKTAEYPNFRAKTSLLCPNELTTVTQPWTNIFFLFISLLFLSTLPELLSLRKMLPHAKAASLLFLLCWHIHWIKLQPCAKWNHAFKESLC